jgi:uncharacterized SAM-binding protein YcdF (DUF218 family)
MLFARARLADLGRFVALALGVFVLLNVFGELIRPRFDTLHDWIALPLPRAARLGIAALAGIVLTAHGLGTRLPRAARTAAAGLLAAISLVALVNAIQFWRGLATDAFDTPAVVPASLLVAVVLAALAAAQTSDLPAPPWSARRVLACAGVCFATAIALPLVRVATFGPTRYDRSADCAVVFGARVYGDGTPSLALADRVDESVRLYHRGQVGLLVMSGAVDQSNGRSEPEAMRARAIAAGVPAEAIVVDEAGVDTLSTVRNTRALMDERGLRDAIVVTHYFHIPRAKLLFDREAIRSFTVPARMSRRLAKEPWFVAREVPGYYHALLLG